MQSYLWFFYRKVLTTVADSLLLSDELYISFNIISVQNIKISSKAKILNSKGIAYLISVQNIHILQEQTQYLEQ